jgi:hypothetical protein
LQIVGNISTTTGLEDAQFLTITNSNATANNYSAIMFKDSDGNNSAGFGVQQISHITNEADIVLSPRLANGDITERMRIKGNGNVGIGTASPCAKLHINGSTGASTYKGFAYTYAGSETLINEVLFQAVVGGYSSNLPIFLFKDERSDQGTTQRIFEIQGGRSGVGTILTTLASGNVGIGTCTPTDKLHVLGADNGITICSITANRPVLNFINGSTSMLKLSANATYGAIASCTGDLMYFYGSNVGIGTNSPTFSNGSGLVVHSDGASRIKLSNPTSGQGATDGFELIMAGTDAYVYNYEAGPMIFGAGNAERMRILSGGNIGIGTTDACSILDVRGTITNGATAGSNSTIDVSPAKQSIASGACVDFPSMSGMIVVNDWTDGTITIFLAGGGSTSAAASAAGQAGALYYNSGVTGYRWCNTKGYTACFGFLVFKTRNNA